MAGEQISLLKQLNKGDAVWAAIRPIIESVLAEDDLTDAEYSHWQDELKKVSAIRNLSRPRADPCQLLGVTFDHSVDEVSIFSCQHEVRGLFALSPLCQKTMLGMPSCCRRYGHAR